MPTLREYAKHFKNEMRCNCDLDNWQPEETTGHSWVCRIHKASEDAYRNSRPLPVVLTEPAEPSDEI